MREYRGKTVVITGAGGGIGAAMADEFTSRGAHLALSDIDGASLDETVRRCAARGATVAGEVLDVADRDAIYDYAGHVAAKFGDIHVVVNNAGVAVHGPVIDTADDDLEWIMRINVWGVVHGSRAFLPHLIASGDGQLANVSSVFGLVAAPKDAAYNASKFAVRGFTESLRQELRLSGAPVAVSCVLPGGIKTGIARSARVIGDHPDSVQKLFDRVAMTSPDKAARIIVNGLRRSQARILVGPDAHAIAVLPRVFGAQYGLLVESAARLLRA